MILCNRKHLKNAFLHHQNKSLFIIVAISWTLFILPLSVQGDSSEDNLILANDLFRAGDFSKAKDLYAEVLKKEPDNYQAILALGKIKLFGNRLEQSEIFLKKAIKINPQDNEPKALLAEAYYRRDNFQEAAPLFRAIGKTAMADKLESFKNLLPNQIEGNVDGTSIKFVRTDPLPVVSIKINNKEEVLFLIDTGGAELILETEFAEKIGAKKFGEEMSSFAGGRKAVTYHGAVDQVQIGDFVVKNVPVSIGEGPKRAEVILGLPIRGILGTVFLYHFIFTLDYPDGQLILLRKTEENMKNMKRLVESKDNISVPFWMAGNHIMVAKATVNGSKPLLFFVDTGMAGGGFDCSENTIKEANIELSKESRQGMGGGGEVQIREGIVREIALGNAKEFNIKGLFGAFPPSMEYQFGFRLAGIISHGFFRPYKLTFDFTTMNLFLKKK
jgi:tetratricopeptide (TPR) repeat protein